MKFFKSEIFNKEQLKGWSLLIGLFLVLPIVLYYLSELLISSFGKGGCLMSSGGLVWLHAGFLLIIPLISFVSWKKVIIFVGIFLSLLIIESKHTIFNNITDLIILYNTYNALYLSAVKSLIEKRYNPNQKTDPSANKVFSITVDIACFIGFAVVTLLTMFVGLFFVLNCS